MTGIAYYCFSHVWRFRRRPSSAAAAEQLRTLLLCSRSGFSSSSIGNAGTLRSAAGASHYYYHSTATTTTTDTSSSSNDDNLKFRLWDSLSQSLKEIPLHYDDDDDVDDAGDASATTTTTAAATTTKKKKKKKEKGLAWYTCGPTTYSDTHLGHARTYVWLDMIRRVLEDVASIRGEPSPLFVMNITDIDDKIIAAAAAPKDSTTSNNNNSNNNNSSSFSSSSLALQISRKAETRFFDDMDRLNCLRPHVTTRVTEYVESDIIPYIERLVQNDMAYYLKKKNNVVVSGISTTTGDGDDDNNNISDDDDDVEGGVYFDVKAFETKMAISTYYGKLAGNNNKNDDDDNDDDESKGKKNKNREDQVQAEEEEDSTTTMTTTQKRDVRDFALWKPRKENEDVYWSSPWGDGRPGWHIECSAMIEAIQNQFQQTHIFMVHAGGIDLKFPHHTNEIAQAEAYHYSNDSSCGTTTTACCSSSNGIAAREAAEREKGDEWIQHWVHMGHLVVKETKMSKSLKNFLTVDELWFDNNSNDVHDQDDDPKSTTTTTTTTSTAISSSSSSRRSNNSRLSSPADDFRWWCLTGGAYGQRQEYSRSKMLIARQKRERILRFLLDGEQWIMEKQQQGQPQQSNDRGDNGHPYPDNNNTKRWSSADHAFFVETNNAATDAYRALLDNMKGSIYAKRLLQIAEAGNSYIRKHPATPSSLPGSSATSNLEPIKEALKKVRKLLALVGFSDLTVNAGLDIHTISSSNHHHQGGGGNKEANNNNNNNNNGATTNYVVGGEKALLEELVRFRALVRSAALQDIKNKKGTENVMAIMKACDQIRDNLPEMGVEVMDTKNNNNEEGGAQWRFCVPKERRKT